MMNEWKKPFAYKGTVSSGSLFAMSVMSAIGDKKIACEGRKAPRSWLWDGGRLLPALVCSAAARVDRLNEALEGLVVPRCGEITYLPRACIQIPEGVEEAARAIIGDLPLHPENHDYIDVTPLIDDFMRTVVANGADVDDAWNFDQYILDGEVYLSMAHNWRAEVDSLE
jgi:hypothetical protein